VDHRDHAELRSRSKLAKRRGALPVDPARAAELQQDDDREQQPERGARKIRKVL